MSPQAFHQILVPYLFAGAALVAILLVTGVLLKRDGEKRRAEDLASGPEGPGAETP
jgi:hypothetical protein